MGYLGKIGGCAQWIGVATIALPLWVKMSSSLLLKFMKRPRAFFQQKNISPLENFRDPIEGLEHRYFEVNGVLLHGLTTGKFRADKELVLFLHGFPETHYSWKHQIRVLSEHFDIIALDLRGFGLSDAPASLKKYRMKELCADIVGVIQSSGHESCLLVAHDWGGAISWNLLANNPEIVERLAIFCSPHPAAYRSSECFNFKQMRHSWCVGIHYENMIRISTRKKNYVELLGLLKMLSRNIEINHYRSRFIRKCRYFLFFMCPWLPELWFRCREFERIDKLMMYPPWGYSKSKFFCVNDLDRIKSSLQRKGALRAAINYYRASIADQTLWKCEILNKTIKTEIKVPVLMAYADNDEAFLSTMFTKARVSIPELHIFKLHQCSHWAQQDRPDLVSQMLLEFLR